MKLLLVAADERCCGLLSFHLRPLGFTVEHLADPVQAIERLDEIDPQAVLFHAGDYPRHWKTALKVAREQRSREELIFVVVAPREMGLEEAAKAAYLGANGIIDTDLGNKQVLYQLEELIRRYKPVADKRSVTRVVPDPQRAPILAFSHPRRFSLVVGRVREISVNGASFVPETAVSIEGLDRGTELPRCGLKLGRGIITLNARVTRNREELGLQFLSFDGDGKSGLLAWIEERSARQLKEAAAEKPAATEEEDAPGC